ncbi:MAG: diaminopimelate decarboxylase [Deltaproteobacteria bacterium]|nr:diaminopimelate decarboxylase [Deltaproteobacteria bacterium]
MSSPTPFTYKNSELYCEQVLLAKIAETVDTPFYVYSKNTIADNVKAFQKAFKDVPHLIAFSTKANSNLSVLNTVIQNGGGLDIVSSGELYRGLKAGVDPKKVVYSGVGKKASEIEYAIKTGILMLNVESAEELEKINEIAERLHLKAPVALRVNPDVDPKTHPYISTGMKKAKFGIPVQEALRLYGEAARMKGLKVVGVDCHIGSQLTDTQPFVDAMKRIRGVVEELRSRNIEITHLDIGGGLGIQYKDEKPPSIEEYAAAILDVLKDIGCTLVLEPGRRIVGKAGALITQVIYNKHGEAKDFVILDAAMNDLIRPSLYEAWHEIIPVKESKPEKKAVDIVGPVCESGDCFAHDRKFPKVAPGDLVAILDAGAYGFTMASNYNTRARPAEVMVSGEKFITVRKRETLEDMIRGESISMF